MKNRQQKGFSIIEMLIVVLVISILMVFASRFANAKVYKPDQQANKFIDVFREAKQRAITQQETMRVEINLNKRTIRLVNENTPGDGGDDKQIREIPLADSRDVIFERPPQNMDAGPKESTPVPEMTFKTPITFEAKAMSMVMASEDSSEQAMQRSAKTIQSPTPEPVSDKIATYRFLKNGNVVDAGFNEAGDGAILTGGTFYFWTPAVNKSGAVTENAQILRAVTLLGSSGITRFWKCQMTDGVCTNWQK